MVCVDTKKKELVGNWPTRAASGSRKGDPVRVDVHDFPDPEVGKAIPYGVYDLAANEGSVNVGDDHDTAAFAVATIGRWWDEVGPRRLPRGHPAADHRRRRRLQRLPQPAVEGRLGAARRRDRPEITVCHFPPGTSKWNKIEHRLFSAISMNWRGRPLTSHEVVVDLIAATTTRTGLKVHARTRPAATTRPASRSPTPSWPPCRSPATTSTATGTTPSPVQRHAQRPRNSASGPNHRDRPHSGLLRANQAGGAHEVPHRPPADGHGEAEQS